jgi:hypothetical protein
MTTQDMARHALGLTQPARYEIRDKPSEFLGKHVFPAPLPISDAVYIEQLRELGSLPTFIPTC